MAESTNIIWADGTFNPWVGCSKVSEACRFCYAEADFDKRRGHAKWGPSGTRVITSDANWRKPLAWNKHAHEDYMVWSVIACVGEAGTTLELVGDSLACRLSDAAIGKAADRLLKRGCVELNGAHRYFAMNYTRPRIFCASLADVFEDWSGNFPDNPEGVHGGVRCMVDSSGARLCTRVGVETARQWPDEAGWRPFTMHDARDRLFRLIDATPNLDWLLLTKRPENIRSMWPRVVLRIIQGEENADGSISFPMDMFCMGATFRHNVWLGTSVENQEAADRRIPEVLRCADLCPVRFLSCEPLLGPVDLTRVVLLPSDAPDLGKPDVSIDCLRGWYAPLGDRRTRINWVIAGGESGVGARPCHPDWVRRLRDDCKAAGVAFLFKQWGEWLPFSQAWTEELREACRAATVRGDQTYFGAAVGVNAEGGLKMIGSPGVNPVGIHRVGKKAAGRLLDGRIHDAIPLLDGVGAVS